MNEFKLDSEPKIKSGFRTPEDYFTSFPDTLKIPIPKKERKVRALFQKRRRAFQLIAAVFVIGMFLSLFNKFGNQDSKIEASELENYITDQSTINQYDLICSLTTEDIEKMKEENDTEKMLLDNLDLTSSDLEQITIE